MSGIDDPRFDMNPAQRQILALQEDALKQAREGAVLQRMNVENIESLSSSFRSWHAVVIGLVVIIVVCFIMFVGKVAATWAHPIQVLDAALKHKGDGLKGLTLKGTGLAMAHQNPIVASLTLGTKKTFATASIMSVLNGRTAGCMADPSTASGYLADMWQTATLGNRSDSSKSAIASGLDVMCAAFGKCTSDLCGMQCPGAAITSTGSAALQAGGAGMNGGMMAAMAHMSNPATAVAAVAVAGLDFMKTKSENDTKSDECKSTVAATQCVVPLNQKNCDGTTNHDPPPSCSYHTSSCSNSQCCAPCGGSHPRCYGATAARKAPHYAGLQ